MSQAETRIAYTGPALESGVMNVRELAPALLALGELCNRANEALTGQEKGVSVQVKADFKSGSFEFAVLVETETWRAATKFFTSADYIAAKELLGLLGLGGSGILGLFAYIKKRRGRKAKTSVETDDGKVVDTFDDGETITAPKEVHQLHETPSVRRAVKKIVAPLASDGIDGLQVRDPKRRENIVEEISQQDAPYYLEVPDSGEVAENEMELLLLPVTVHLEGERQWVFRRGSGSGETIKAKITDEEFAGKMAAGEIRFARGDMLRAKVHERQWDEGGELKTKHEIVKVIKYIEARRQQQLPIESPPSPEGK